MDSLVLQTAIGLVFVFATFAAVTSVITELVARYLGLRGEYLLRGIQSLVDGKTDLKLDGPLDILKRVPVVNRLPGVTKAGSPAADPTPAPEPPALGDKSSLRLLASPVIGHSADKGRMPGDAGAKPLSRNERRKLPSYLSSRAFASAVFDLLVPDDAGRTTFDELEREVGKLPEPLRKPLQSLLVAANGEVTAFRRGVEQWYDDHMARVSGWYKRHVRWISLAIGAVVVLLFNLNAIEITRALYTDQGLRTSVVLEATYAADCRTKEPAKCLQDMRQKINEISGSGLPVGWRTVPECAVPNSCNFFEAHGLVSRTGGFGSDVPILLLTLLGWALMVGAMLPGARFWFDALSRLGSLRSSGPKPPPAPA